MTLVQQEPGLIQCVLMVELTEDWLLLDPEPRWPWLLECPPPEEGTGASPSSAMRDRYSLSIRALSWADWGGSPVLWAEKELGEEAWRLTTDWTHQKEESTKHSIQ